MKPKKKLTLFLRIIISLILFYQSYQKLIGNEEIVTLFQLLHLEPIGRIVWSILEIIIALLLVLPRIHFLAMLINTIMISLVFLSHFILFGVMMDEKKGGLLTFTLTVISANFIYLYLQNAKVKKFLNGLKRGKLILFIKVKNKKNLQQQKTLTD